MVQARETAAGGAVATLRPVPPVVAAEGEGLTRWFREFLATGIANPNTRSAYTLAIERFLAWCQEGGLSRLGEIDSPLVAEYLKEHRGSEATVRQHLAALRLFFRALAGRGVIRENPASRVHAPRARRSPRRAPLLSGEEIRAFLDGISKSSLMGLRDRAIVSVMVHAFARAGAVAALRREDYSQRPGQSFLRLRRWTGKHLEVPLHRDAELAMDAYLARARILTPQSPLFCSVDRRRRLSELPLTRTDVLRMVKRRARRSGFSPRVSCRTLRASGIRSYLEAGGSLDQVLRMTGYRSARAIRPYAPPEFA